MEEDRRRSIANKALFISSPHSSLGSTLFIKDFAFALKLDLQHFKPEEIKVSIRQGTLTVEVKHKEWLGGYGVLGQNVVLRLNTLPGNVAIDKAEIRLSRDGMLSISISKDRTASLGGPKFIAHQWIYKGHE
ncbi:Hypothetical predicted protein [Cloeon dipterum]|uniref:SHSP domain-containing protein n=1 Tax=Cloeon dipterum TaxID=197152 RepID=A0A8S1CB84_9INSE|nr:Hypothetical predicted protein [Cloeon dipterum]